MKLQANCVTCWGLISILMWTYFVVLYIFLSCATFIKTAWTSGIQLNWTQHNWIWTEYKCTLLNLKRFKQHNNMLSLNNQFCDSRIPLTGSSLNMVKSQLKIQWSLDHEMIFMYSQEEMIGCSETNKMCFSQCVTRRPSLSSVANHQDDADDFLS